jgi:hypothetical protein
MKEELANNQLRLIHQAQLILQSAFDNEDITAIHFSEMLKNLCIGYAELNKGESNPRKAFSAVPKYQTTLNPYQGAMMAAPPRPMQAQEQSVVIPTKPAPTRYVWGDGFKGVSLGDDNESEDYWKQNEGR